MINNIKLQKLVEQIVTGTEWLKRPYLVEGLTFEQLHLQAKAIKNAMTSLGGDNSPVCLCTDNRGYMAAAMMAVLTGAPALLFPFALSEQILAEARVNARFTHALVDGHFRLPDGLAAIPVPDTEKCGADSPSAPALDPDAAWIYLYTGGSTGSPRIWSKSARNLLMEAANIAKAFNIRSEDVILCSVPPNHIYGLLYSVLLPLVCGASVSVRTPSFPNEIVQAIDETQATVLVSIPAHYRALKEMTVSRHRIHTAFSSAGALSEQDDHDFFRSAGIAVTEIYGSTETGGIAFRQRCSGRTVLQPFGYVDVKIEGERLRVRSDFLSAELPKDEQGFFLTADRVTTAGQSGFEILGRSDGIVKVGGKRVDLAQIRQVIVDIPGVQDAYAMALPVRSGRENEIVVMVAGSMQTERIMQAAKDALPPYAVPRRVKVVEKIPMSATGKYNREAIEKTINADRE